MNVLGLYRLLPRTNCGLCRAGKCMAFAVALAKGETDPAECPGLTEEARLQLRSGSGQGDWREAVIAGLRTQVAALDLAEIAAGLGARPEDGALCVRCLGRDYKVAADGSVSALGTVAPWTQILLLHYVRTRGSAGLSGRWVGFTDLKAALMKSKSFARECEEPLRELFDRDAEGAQRALEVIGGVLREGTPAPVAWEVFALPRVPVLVLYWPRDEEFPSKLKVLFDATADRYLDVESLTFLVEGLVKYIESGPEAPPHD